MASTLEIQDPGNLQNTTITLHGEGRIDAGGQGRSGKLTLRDDAGNEEILLDGKAGSALVSGNVGIGTKDPKARLDVAGLTQTEDLAVKGTIQNAELETLKEKVETLEEQLVKSIEISGESLIGFEAERNHLVAGHADRFIHTRRFIPFLISDIVLTYKSRSALTALFSQTLQLADLREVSKVVEIYASQLLGLGQAKIEELAKPGSPQHIKFNWALVSSLMAKAYERTREEIKKGKGFLFSVGPEYQGDLEVGTLSTAFRQEFESHGITLSHDLTIETPVKGGKWRIKQNDTGPTYVVNRGGEALNIYEKEEEEEVFSPSLLPQIFASSRLYTGFMPSGLWEMHEWLPQLQIIAVDIDWLGVMFYDRVRFRPAGVVVGDQIYALSLAPGEEVQLTQRSETKRSRSFEEIRDRETERELEFSSTWSTDISQEDSRSESNSFGGNLSVNATVPIPEAVTVGGSGGLNVQGAIETSENEQRTFTYEVTSRLTSRARQQHKTTFKISTDLTEEFGSRRVLRNPNPTRALTLNFYKLYQKHRVLLERYDAKLCLSLPVIDPGQLARQELLSELAKLDPNNPANYCCSLPALEERDTIEQSFQGKGPAGEIEFTNPVPITISPRTDQVLSHYDLKLMKWEITVTDGKVSKIIEMRLDENAFRECGGAIKFSKEPRLLTGEEQHISIWVGLPSPNRATGDCKNRLYNKWYTSFVKIGIVLDWIPADETIANYKECIRAEQQRIRELCTVDNVIEILQRVARSSRELVFKELLETHILVKQCLPGQDSTPGGPDLDDVRNSFDWNEAYIEYLPWWLTVEGRRNYQTIRQAILNLPVDAPMEQLLQPFLTASIARAHLPIKPDREHEAVDMMIRWGIQEGQTNEVEKAYQDTIHPFVDEFVAFRELHYGTLDRALPTYDQVMDVGPELGTPTGATAWNNDWEKSQRRFDVLDQWSELLPTDGVHVEPALSTGQSADELRAEALVSDLASAADHRNLMTAKAEAMREAVGREDVSVTVGISDSSG